jgi:DNA-directed RNA polymerase subunit RPC12/RpoP
MGCGPKKGKRRSKSKTEHSKSYTSGDTRGTSSLVMPRVPQKCSNCDATINSTGIKWIGPTSVECPYCGSILFVEFEKIV